MGEGRSPKYASRHDRQVTGWPTCLDGMRGNLGRWAGAAYSSEARKEVRNKIVSRVSFGLSSFRTPIDSSYLKEVQSC